MRYPADWKEEHTTPMQVRSVCRRAEGSRASNEGSRQSTRKRGCAAVAWKPIFVLCMPRNERDKTERTIDVGPAGERWLVPVQRQRGGLSRKGNTQTKTWLSQLSTAGRSMLSSMGAWKERQCADETTITTRRANIGDHAISHRQTAGVRRASMCVRDCPQTKEQGVD